MRVRLRPAHTADDLAKIYDKPYVHTKWQEHERRVAWTIKRLNHFITLRSEIARVADLSCGDGAILKGLVGPVDRIYGDLVFTDLLDVIGPIEESVQSVGADLLICSETLEHLDDPDTFLRDAATNFKFIAIPTPLGETEPEKNWEHYWGWDLIGVNDMLRDTGWFPLVQETLPMDFYTYQFWIARSHNNLVVP